MHNNSETELQESFCCRQGGVHFFVLDIRKDVSVFLWERELEFANAITDSSIKHGAVGRSGNLSQPHLEKDSGTVLVKLPFDELVGQSRFVYSGDLHDELDS